MSTTLTKTMASPDGGRRRRWLSAGAAVAAIAVIIAIIVDSGRPSAPDRGAVEIGAPTSVS